MRIDSVSLGAFSIDQSILVARDDLFPLFLGGNKARKMVNIIGDIDRNRNNAVVTTGGIQSNHCRVVALACTLNHWKCKLILHGSKEQFFLQKGNALLMRMADVELEFVKGNQIGPAMDRAMDEFTRQGYRPYYLFGGGHNRAGTLAYVEAMYELKKSLTADKRIDHVFLASGTGSTQAGILAGCKKLGWTDTQVHGISVAREKKRGTEAILESLEFLGQDGRGFESLIDFSDEFLFGGYGNYTRPLQDLVSHTASETGILLDNTYTGKAFYGMIETIKKQRLTGEIMFWHTGGIFNLMA